MKRPRERRDLGVGKVGVAREYSLVKYIAPII
jgi:hypothetical protein